MRKWPLFLGASSLCGLLIVRGMAQDNQPGFRRVEPRPPFVPPIIRPFPAPLTELRLVSQNAKIEINGVVAKTHLRQTLQNPTSRPLEGSYLFALPKGASVSNFAMTMGGKRLEAEILEGDKAREIYTGIVQKLRDPAILEFLDRDLVRAKIFPVPANGNVEIELDYAQTVEGNRLSLPLRAPAAGQNGARANVEISLAGNDVRGVYSPSHSVEIRRSGDKTLVSGEFNTSDSDFSLFWTRGDGKIGLDLLTYKEPGEDGYFLLLAAPDPKIATQEIEAKDVVFVFDTSGSMEGAKIEQARRALKSLLGNLNPKDRFNIVTFASSVQPFRNGLVEVSPANLDAARGFADGIKAVGGTNISEALESALKMTQNSPRPQQVVFMTDGQPTVGETGIDKILSQTKTENSTKARLFVFGVGNDVNTRLLDSLAEDNHGASDYVLPKEDIEVKVGALYEKIAYPVLSDAKIDFGTMGAYDVYPPQLPDLFRGSQVTVFGRLRSPQNGKISLSGQSGGQTIRVAGVVTDGGTAEMPKLWATRKVGYLLDDARRANRPISDEVRDEVIKLSRKFGIVTPLTAALITEDGVPIDSGVIRRQIPMLGNLPDTTGNLYRGRSVGAASANGAFSSGGFGGGSFGGGSFGGGSAGAPYADTGAAGLTTSQAYKTMREGRANATKNVQTIEGKTFVLKEDTWTDSVLPLKTTTPPRVIKFASKEYFELIKDAKLAKWLSVGERVTLVWNGQVLQIEP
jgi:Ca-activated chloride channel family protein